MEELDLKELIEIFWNKKAQIILIILIFMVIGFIYSVMFVTPMYSSSTTLVLAGTSNNNTGENQTSETITTADLTINSKLVSTYSVLVKSENILGQVIDNLGIDVDEEQLRKNVEVTSVEDTELIKITVSDPNAKYAERIANEIAKVFKEKIAGEVYNINNVYIWDEAKMAVEPYNVNYIKNIVIFALIGAIISIIYVLVANMLDTTIKTQEDIEKCIKVPVLASIPMYDIEMTKLKKKGGRR